MSRGSWISIVWGLGVLGCGDTPVRLPDAGPDAGDMDRGTVTVNWTLSDGQDPITCGDVAGITVRVELTPVDAQFGATDSFACGAASGTTRQLGAGTSDLSIDLLAPGSRSLIGDPVEVAGVTVSIGEDTPVTGIAFEVATSGDLRFQLATPGTDNQCQGGGGPIVDMSLELQDGEGACVPTTFTVSGAGDVVNNCTGTVFGACIEKSQTVTVAGAVSGEHKLAVIGREAGDLPCWTRVSQFVLPGGNLELDLGTLGLIRDTQVAGCE